MGSYAKELGGWIWAKKALRESWMLHLCLNIFQLDPNISLEEKGDALIQRLQNHLDEKEDVADFFLQSIRVIVKYFNYEASIRNLSFNLL